MRPRGVAVEFGETREQALRREFAEELGCAVIIHDPWRVFENICFHEGCAAHDFLFAAEAQLLDETLYSKAEILFPEADGLVCKAPWVDLEEIASGRLAVLPVGLETLFSNTPAR